MLLYCRQDEFLGIMRIGLTKYFKNFVNPILKKCKNYLNNFLKSSFPSFLPNEFIAEFVAF